MYTQPLNIKKGLSQGFIVILSLFKIYSDKALKMELQVQDEGVVSLYFGNDQVGISEGQDDLNLIVRKLQEEHNVTWLTMNMEKS